jgi:hypothetical protein
MAYVGDGLVGMVWAIDWVAVVQFPAGTIFLSSTAHKTGSGATKPPIHYVPAALSSKGNTVN